MVSSMNVIDEPDNELLRQQIVETQEKLTGLERDLHAIDAELDSLGAQRVTYDLLEQACDSLEKLEELGAAELFWGQAAANRTADHVREVRDRAGVYLGRIGEIEDRRQQVAGQLNEGRYVLDILEGDLYELEIREEERKAAWVIERDLVIPDRAVVMPWAKGEDDQRLHKSLAVNLIIALLLGLIVPQIDLPLPELEAIPEVPDRFARLIERALPPPPPPPVVEEAPPEEVEPEPVVVEELPEEVPEIIDEPAPTVAEEPAPEEPVRAAGILAFRESFASLKNDLEPAQLGAQARINDAGESAVGRTERLMVTSQAPGSSGGINLASLSRNVAGGGGTGEGLDGVAVTRVASSIGGTGGGDRPLAGGGALAGRTDEEIQIVFDRYKAALYRLYNRELRNDPTLRGQIVLQLTIEPDGSVSFCEVESSDMGAPTLEQQVADRVKQFDFGAKEGISAITILYPIDFLPAA
jgi:outer membrane biosynthesis protein TonB/HPt (histidine-containing phosphotransfer) domain-containing protein